MSRDPRTRTALYPVMTDTKWRELIADMRDLHAQGLCVQHQGKDVDGPWPSPPGWDGDWFHHLRPWNRLEWVDVRYERRAPDVRLTADEIAAVHAQICARLRERGIPFSIGEGRVRVWGYTRTSA